MKWRIVPVVICFAIAIVLNATNAKDESMTVSMVPDTTNPGYSSELFNMVRAYRNAVLTLADNVETDLPFDTVSFARPGYATTQILSGKYFIAPADGIYDFYAHVTFAAVAPAGLNIRQLKIYQETAAGVLVGIVDFEQATPPAGGVFSCPLNGFTSMPLSKGDKVYVSVLQNSGGNLDLITTANGGGIGDFSTFAVFKYVGPIY